TDSAGASNPPPTASAEASPATQHESQESREKEKAEPDSASASENASGESTETSSTTAREKVAEGGPPRQKLPREAGRTRETRKLPRAADSPALRGCRQAKRAGEWNATAKTLAGPRTGAITELRSTSCWKLGTPWRGIGIPRLFATCRR